MSEDITCEIVYRDDLTHIADLPFTFARSWQDELAGPGVASVSFANNDPALADVDLDTAILFKLNGTTRFRMLVESAVETNIDPGEEADETTIVTGRGPLAALQDVTVYPDGGPERLPIESDRIFSWPSPPPIYDDSDWAVCGALGTVFDPHPYWAVPQGWPLGSTAQIIGSPDYDDTAAPVGNCYFRKTITLAGPVNAVVVVAFDNAGQVWVDGSQFLTTTQAAGQNGLVYVSRFGVSLSAGDHLIAAVCENQPLFGDVGPGPILGDPIGFVLDAFEQLPDGTLGASLFSTDATWLCKSFPPEAPGITVGRLLRVVIEEAQARGALPGLALDFDDDNDTAGEPWVGTTDAATKVGYTYLQFFTELASSACDLWWHPDEEVLSAWVYATRGDTTSASYHPPTDPHDPTSGNLASCKRSRTYTPANTLLVRWSGGWREVTDLASSGEEGPRREATLGLGAIQSASQVDAMASAELDAFADTRQQIDVDVQPAGTGDAPYTDFTVGDTVTVTAKDAAPDAVRVQRIAVSEDLEGNVVYGLVVEDVVLGEQERLAQWLSKMANGTLGGDSTVATPVGTIPSGTSQPAIPVLGCGRVPLLAAYWDNGNKNITDGAGFVALSSLGAWAIDFASGLSTLTNSDTELRLDPRRGLYAATVNVAWGGDYQAERGVKVHECAIWDSRLTGSGADNSNTVIYNLTGVFYSDGSDADEDDPTTFPFIDPAVSAAHSSAGHGVFKWMEIMIFWIGECVPDFIAPDTVPVLSTWSYP